MKQIEKDFLAWYLSGSDQEQYDIVSNIGRRIVEQLEESGSAYLSVGDLMNECMDVYLDENK
jgi:hypothetical protein